jgi:hypothetical protein
MNSPPWKEKRSDLARKRHRALLLEVSETDQGSICLFLAAKRLTASGPYRTWSSPSSEAPGIFYYYEISPLREFRRKRCGSSRFEWCCEYGSCWPSNSARVGLPAIRLWPPNLSHSPSSEMDSMQAFRRISWKYIWAATMDFPRLSDIEKEAWIEKFEELWQLLLSMKYQSWK